MLLDNTKVGIIIMFLFMHWHL